MNLICSNFFNLGILNFSGINSLVNLLICGCLKNLFVLIDKFRKNFFGVKFIFLYRG